MTVEEMREAAQKMSDIAMRHSDGSIGQSAEKMQSTQIIMTAEICERLDKLIALGERDDG